MNLANLFLFGLGAAALAYPLWIHLRLGRVKKRAVVSSLRLMRASPQSSRRPRKIVDLPLLLLRSLIFALLALGFGRLLIHGMSTSASQKYEVYVVDVSASMQAKNGSGTNFSVAQAAVLQSLGKLNSSSRVAIVQSPAGGDTVIWKNPAQAIEQVKALKPGCSANRIASALREAKRLLGDMPDDHPKAIHVVSDFQQSAFSGIDEITVPPGVELDVVKCGELHTDNRGVAVAVAKAGLSSQSVYSFNNGSGGKLALVSDDDKVTELSVAPGEGAARLSHAASNGDWVTRKLESKDDDAIALDNTGYDAFRVQDPVPVWLWEPKGELPEDSDGASHVYEQASYYIRRALQPAAGDEGSFSRFRPRLLSAADLNGTAKAEVNGETPRLLIVPASSNIPPELAAIARRTLDQGGGVIFFGGPALNVASFASSFGEMAGVKVEAKQPCQLNPALDDIPADGLWSDLDPSSQRQMTRAALHFRHGLTMASGTEALVQYADGVPFITESRTGKGRAYFVNTSSDRAWSDWPASAPLFIPAMHLLAARALDDGAVRFDHEPLIAGEKVTLKVGRAYAGKSLKCGGDLLPVDVSGTVAGVSFAQPGLQTLTLEDGTAVGKIAVNFPASESVLDCYSEPVVRQRLESLRQTVSGAVVRWDREEQGGAAWRLALCAAALLLVIEPVIAARREKI